MGGHDPICHDVDFSQGGGDGLLGERVVLVGIEVAGRVPWFARPSRLFSVMSDLNFLRRVLTARVYDVAVETPLELAPELSRRFGNNILLKREDLQDVFSFKIRGAYNKMVNLSDAERQRGVVASSAGNHAQGVALAARELGCTALIVMPATAPSLKVDAVRALGAEVVLHGDSYSDAFALAQKLEVERGCTFVHPFDDIDVIAGQATIGMEILSRHAGPIAAVFVPIGGGGLAAGVGGYVKQVRPEVKVIGVQHAESTAMVQSIKAGHRVELDNVGLFSDGTAVKLVGETTFAMVSDHVDDIVVVDTDETCAAIKDVFTDTRSLLEPAGALSVAGLKRYLSDSGAESETFVAVASGANMNFDRMRFVAERAEIGEKREAVFAVTIPEQPGSFLRFCQVLGAHNVTEFNYRMAPGSEAHVFVGVNISNRAELVDAFDRAGFTALDLTGDEFAKAHLRHLVGGRSSQASDELLYRFEFPERPGALTEFLAAMAPDWNISLFHYRNHGADTARVVVGLQVPPEDTSVFERFLTRLNYRYWDESSNAAYHLFLGS